MTKPDGNKEFIDRHGPSMVEISKVLAGQAEPTRELFIAMASILSELLAQHEGALEQIDKTRRNAGKRERRAH